MAPKTMPETISEEGFASVLCGVRVCGVCEFLRGTHINCNRQVSNGGSSNISSCPSLPLARPQLALMYHTNRHKCIYAVLLLGLKLGRGLVLLLLLLLLRLGLLEDTHFLWASAALRP